MATIMIDVSEKNEGTRAPWWAIVDPRQNMRCSVHEAAGQITGPFFSREEAQGFLTATRYNFSDRAQVYCLSGTYSRQYRDALENRLCEVE